jgi:hypothetical protein
MNRNANGARRDVVYRHYEGVVDFQMLFSVAVHASMYRRLRPQEKNVFPVPIFVGVRKIAKSNDWLPHVHLPVCPSVCLSAWNNSAPSGRIFVKFENFSKICRENTSFI